MGVEAVKLPFGPRLGAPVPLAMREQREQSMTWVTGDFDNFLGLPLTLVCRSWIAVGLAPVMYWAVRTTLYSVLWSDAEQLSYQSVMQPIRMLSMVQL